MSDPAQRVPGIGKMKRVREVLGCAIDQDIDAGDRFVFSLMANLKSTGAFRCESPDYVGEELICAARTAFRTAGYELDVEGNLRPSNLDNLTAPEITEALKAYVRRARVGDGDAALVVGTGKDLVEATARHMLVQTTGAYPVSADFPTTLYQAFDRLGLATNPELLQRLDRNPQLAIEQSLYLLANAVNRLRNAEGTGHGRPFPSSVSAQQASLAIQSMGIISQMLLDRCSAK
jgi:hypothetical protein